MKLNDTDHNVQADLFDEEDESRRLLDQLLEDSRLYSHSKDYLDLLETITLLREFAPFNAMLLQIQKPGLKYAAPQKDWWDKFTRWPKEDSRPLLILWPFAPVVFVYDYLDTEGQDLPEDMYVFPASGELHQNKIEYFFDLCGKNHIDIKRIDAGDNKAGEIQCTHRGSTKKEASNYLLKINENHSLPTQFTTLAHELGHLFLGHLGEDKKLKISGRRPSELKDREIEAESVAYLVCNRNGVKPKSQTYLCSFVEQDTVIDSIDIYSIMKAAGDIEKLLGIDHTSVQ